MGRDEEIEYAEKNNIPVSQTKQSPYSYDENMWANTGEGGEIENPSLIPPLEKILKWCTLPELAPDKKETITLSFKKGVLTSLNEVQKPLKDMIMELNAI